MSKIAFFGIPAHGHTNPTLGVVKELVERGHEVWYHSYRSMQEKIEATGAKFISCDEFDNQMSLTPEDADRIGTDLVFSMEVMVNTTLAMDEAIIEELREWQPDVVVADSMAVWGKLAALKLDIPFVSSTTTFAFNKYSSKIMKQSFGQMMKTLLSMGKANKVVKRLEEKGYPVKSTLGVIANDNDTNTIVYTSPEFQPCANTFSDKYIFVGPSIQHRDVEEKQDEETCIYISLGTVNNQRVKFFKNCISAFKNQDVKVILSIGDVVKKEDLGEIPENFTVESSVDQIKVLQQVDVFLTHCGMNSTNEAIYYKVPMVLYPQTSEQFGVANRVEELGAGMLLASSSPEDIRETVREVVTNAKYKENVTQIAKSFEKCGGAKAAADFIEKVTNK